MIRRRFFRPPILALLLLFAFGSAAQDRPTDIATNTRGFGAYTYDGAGNITRAGDDTFDYDQFGRIRKATVAGITQTFTYDRHGNITNIATTGEADHAITVDASNRLAGATNDGSGNLLSNHGGTFVYDGLNVVKEFTPTNGNRHLYLYSASNERIATVELLPGGQQQSDWTIRDEAGKVLRRYRKHPNGTWSWEEDYIYRGSQLLAAEVPAPEKVRHFHLDHLGTPRLITGNGGAVLAERTYGAFGRGLMVESTPPPDEPAQFTGHERDNFHLDYMHARYYDPMMGRFLSVDPGRDWEPKQPQSWNSYAYVRNNPINKVDPSGKCSAAIALTFFPLCGTADFVDYVRERGPELREGVRALADDSAPPVEKAMGAGVIGLIAIELGANAIEPGERAAVQGVTTFGYRSFTAFKRAMGAAGDGMEWHHIVEQTGGNQAAFGGRALHNLVNLIRVDRDTHIRITAFYSSKIKGLTGDLTVRQWLSKKSFKEQYEFGVKVLQDFGVIQ